MTKGTFINEIKTIIIKLVKTFVFDSSIYNGLGLWCSADLPKSSAAPPHHKKKKSSSFRWQSEVVPRWPDPGF